MYYITLVVRHCYRWGWWSWF